MKKSILILGFLALTSGGQFLSAQVGINTENPTNTLHIVGDTATIHGQAFRLVDGNEGAGKFLASDANGVGTWQYFYGPTPRLMTNLNQDLSAALTSPTRRTSVKWWPSALDRSGNDPAKDIVFSADSVWFSVPVRGIYSITAGVTLANTDMPTTGAFSTDDRRYDTDTGTELNNSYVGLRIFVNGISITGTFGPPPRMTPYSFPPASVMVLLEPTDIVYLSVEYQPSQYNLYPTALRTFNITGDNFLSVNYLRPPQP
ncbi:MAG: hypothetical protein LBS01_02150 [Prevotellaceae bacterium]|jgi:hypothetical protein|nr:hypothetical protein [Prevotellaceae bacterium]